nr:MAG TPA: hypothetical protein [Caudoviricetes sp.]
MVLRSRFCAAVQAVSANAAAARAKGTNIDFFMIKFPPILIKYLFKTALSTVNLAGVLGKMGAKNTPSRKAVFRQFTGCIV